VTSTIVGPYTFHLESCKRQRCLVLLKSAFLFCFVFSPTPYIHPWCSKEA
jgi:hypothetical protein